jgi:hypothetical protein
MRSIYTQVVLACALVSVLSSTTAEASDLPPADARAIAKDAYIYGFPIVDSYRIIHAYFVDRTSPEYKADWNQIRNFARVFTPEDKAVQTPNSDTPYSFLGMDLRAEPIVLTVPAVEEGRYFSVQLIDLYTFNFDYIGSRATGSDGGSFVIAGPNWKGELPKGIRKVIRSETELALAAYRTQLLSPGDIENVKKVQAGYKAQPLSQFLGQPAPCPAPKISFPAPLTPQEQKSSLHVFDILNFALQFCPTHPSEQELMARFARLDIGAGRKFDADRLAPDVRKAVEEGIADAWLALAGVKRQLDEGMVTSGDTFGSRAHLKNNYLYRMLAAVVGIYGNSKEEAMYPMYTADSGGQPLDGSRARYMLRLAPGQFPPANAFWSLTLYELPQSLLSANPLNRYLLNSPMLPRFRRDADGGVTLRIQNESPGEEWEANWLPAPKGPFFMAMRVYWPKEEALSGTWKQPPLNRVE